MTPAYALKHWWRAARLPGESLRAFARRYRSGRTAAVWMRRKNMTGGAHVAR